MEKIVDLLVNYFKLVITNAWNKQCKMLHILRIFFCICCYILLFKTNHIWGICVRLFYVLVKFSLLCMKFKFDSGPPGWISNNLYKGHPTISFWVCLWMTDMISLLCIPFVYLGKNHNYFQMFPFHEISGKPWLNWLINLPDRINTFIIDENGISTDRHRRSARLVDITILESVVQICNKRKLIAVLETWLVRQGWVKPSHRLKERCKK